MNLLKKISVILPIFAVSLFVFTLAVLNRQDKNTKEAAVTVFTDNTVTSTNIEKSESSQTTETVTYTNVSDESQSQTTAVSSAASQKKTAAQTKPKEPGVTAVIITPYSKKPVAEALATLPPEPVVTPYEIILESITLVYPTATAESQTTTTESETAPESDDTTADNNTSDTTQNTDESFDAYQVACFK